MNNMHVLKVPAGREGHIAVAESMVSRQSCQELVSACKQSYEQLFHVGPTMGGVQKHIKNTMDFSFSYDELHPLNLPSHNTFMKISYEVDAAVNTAISLYLEEYPHLRAAPNPRHTGFRLQKYLKGDGFYRVHIDGDVWTQDSERGRILGMVMYLNDIEIGGETMFPDQNVRVKGRAGDIAIFPAAWTHPHAGCVPVSDDKWMISTFIICDVPDLHRPYALNNKIHAHTASSMKPTIVGE